MNRIDKRCLYLVRRVAVLSLFVCAPRMMLADAITRTFSFSASGFSSQAPQDPVIGNFTVSFDPTTTSIAGIDSFTSNLDVLRPISYIFRPGQNSGELTVGTSCSLADGCSAASGSDDLLLDIYGAATATPSFSQFAYSTTTGGVFEASTTTLNFADVPEPSSLFIVCAGVLGFALAAGKTRLA